MLIFFVYLNLCIYDTSILFSYFGPFIILCT